MVVGGKLTIVPHVDDGDGWVACCGGGLRFLSGEEDLGEGCRCDALQGADCGHSGLGRVVGCEVKLLVRRWQG